MQPPAPSNDGGERNLASPDGSIATEGAAARLALPGTYEVLSNLASGSFGTVYLARQRSTGQRVAIKLLHATAGLGSAELAEHTERFRREMHLCSELSHPNIVRLIDSGEVDTGELYVVFEFVPGMSLREVLNREGRLEIGEAVHLMSQVLDALSSAHALGIVHRDLKPENVMVTRTGARRNAMVLDFGLGSLVSSESPSSAEQGSGRRVFAGTPGYAAPEQIRGDDPSTRSDLYSWGLLFLECLTGEPAMGRGSGAEVVHRQLDARPVAIPEFVRGLPLGRLLQVVTAKRVLERDATSEGLLLALDRMGRGALEGGEPFVQVPGDAEHGERRQVTIVSCRLQVDLSGRPADVEEVDQLVHALHTTFAEIAAQGGGRLASAVGDRIVLLFGYSQTSEDSAGRAVRAALELVESVTRSNERSMDRGQRFALRVGIHTGVVVAREHRRGAGVDLVGVTPQVASAIEARARSGEILVSDPTRALLRGGFTVESECTLEPDEAGAPLEVFRLCGRPAKGSSAEHAAVETPLVGRRDEVEALVQAWRDAVAGAPRSLLILGEAGIGKSRMLRELRREVPHEAWLVCRCTAENRTSPLRPFVDLLASVREPIADLLARHGFDVPEVLPLFESLLGRATTDSKDELTLTPERQKELTLDALLQLLLRMAGQSPLVLVIEDLHWADATSVDLVTRLVHELDAARTRSSDVPQLCAVLTGRPEFSPRWSPSPGSLLVLARLKADEVRAMLTAGADGGDGLSDAIVAQIVERGDGIPLFVEEMMRLVLQASRAREPGVTPSRVEPLEAVIPDSLRDLLTARLDAVHDAARETAQLAAVIGREFRYELLRAVSSRAEIDLRDEVRALSEAGLLFRQHNGPQESYLFKHALLRDAAYESIVRPARRRLHERVARTLTERFPDFARRRPDALALHYEGAGEIEHAVDSWQLAADSALRKAAFVESQQQAERALGLLDQVADQQRRERLRLELLTTIGTVQFNVLGLSAPAVEETFREAQALAQRADSELTVKVLNGLWSVQFARGSREGVEQLLPFMHRLAETTSDPLAMLTGNTAIGFHAFWSGDFAKGRAYAARGREYHGHPDVRRFVRNYGWDGTMYCYAVEIQCLWHLGLPDQARALCREMMDKVEQERNPTAIAAALGFDSMLMRYLGDLDAAFASADRLTLLAGEQKLYLWLAIGLCGRGSALVASGDGAGALPFLQQGLMILKSIGTMLSYSYGMVEIAEANLLIGDLDAADAAIDEGFELCGRLFARYYEPDLHRFRGLVLARRGDADGAEASVRRALQLARERGARSYELRAATTLAELLALGSSARHAGDEIRTTLEPFTEGFETSDVQRAKAVQRALDGLKPPSR